LPAVGRVGQDFLVTGHGGIEHHFTDRNSGCAYGKTLEYGTVFESENG
jgi:hypothetical protein